MNLGLLKKSFKAAAAAVLVQTGVAFAADAQSAAAQTGPTPYPAADNNAAWPGKGVIRKFGWMVDNRAYFWKNREKDQGAVVFVGDSLTGGWKNLAKDFPGLKVANRGIGGDTSRGVLFRFQEDVVDLNPKAIVINAGSNDLTAMGKAADALSNLADMIALAQKKNPDVKIVLCTVPPSNNPKAPIKIAEKRALNAGIVKLAEGKPNVAVCDLFTALANAEGTPAQPECFAADQLHFAAPGYAKWIELLKPAFEKLKVQ